MSSSLNESTVLPIQNINHLENGDVEDIEAGIVISDVGFDYMKNDLKCPVCVRERGLDSVLCKHDSRSLDLSNNCEALILNLHSRLHGVSMECVALQSEVEVLRKTLASKSEAVEILKKKNSESTEVSSKSRNYCYENTLLLQKEIANLHTHLELSKGSIISQQQAYDERIQQLCNAKENLTNQLENLQLKTRQLLEENMYLLHKNTSLLRLAQTSFTMNGVSRNDFNEVSKSIMLDRHSLHYFADKATPVSSEALLCVLEQQVEQSNISNSIEIIVDPVKSNLQSPPYMQRTRPSFLELIKKPVSMPRSFIPTRISYCDKESQCDINPSFLSWNSRLLSVTIDCVCGSSKKRPACLCAQNAIRIQRDLLRRKCQVLELSKMLKNAQVIETAYRYALDEQFKRNREMAMQLSNLIPHIPSNLLEKCRTSPIGFPKDTLNHFGLSTIRLSNDNEANARTFNRLVSWLQEVIKSTAVSLRKITKPYLVDRRADLAIERTASKLKQPDLLNTSQITRRTESLYDEFKCSYNSKSYESPSRSSSNETTTLATRRRLSRRGFLFPQLKLRAMSADEVNIAVDKMSTPSRRSPPPPSPSEPIVYRRKVAKMSAKYVPRRMSRGRSPNREMKYYDNNKENDEILYTALMSQLLLKLNEISELITKHQLIYDKNVGRSSSVSSIL